MKIFLDSLGCRLNQSEMETMARQWLAAGHQVVAQPTAADTIVLNTCAVTAAAAKDARGRARWLRHDNPAAELILTGCYATLSPGEAAALPGVGRVVANADKERLVQLITPPAGAAQPVFDREPLIRDYWAAGLGGTRAFVKAQDGCDNRCTFCVTTIARGPGRSRPLVDVVAEVQALATAGYREAVLTGVHLGSYGHDQGRLEGLHQLVMAILADTDIARLRLSSLEPWDLEPAFFELWQNPRLLPHLHLPLQAGSDAVLKRMARRTTRASFRDLAAAARAAIPDLNLSTDLIVGFPGETESEFQASLEFVQEIGFARLHVFSYSPRPGTAAARFQGQVAPAVKKERAQRMIEVGQQLSLAFHRRYEGQVVNVLWEGVVAADERGLRWAGYSDNYLRVTAYGPADARNQITPTRLTAARPEGLAGIMVGQPGFSQKNLVSAKP
ncbi:MAG: tRNA (N(6)-L-threonylcarbamoyladenosine(37)-C(2))-methylthiotransferase MtaB [Chloroflexota bacterium]